MVTSKKYAYLSIGSLPISIYEYIFLTLNANKIMVEIIKTNTRKNKHPSTNIFLKYLNGLDNAFTQIRNNFKEQNILDVIQNLSNHTKRSFFTLNKKLIISTY